MLETTIDKLFDKAVKHYSKKIAFKDFKKEITYEKLGKDVNKIANKLKEIGYKKEDAIGIWMENSIEYVKADFALSKLGSIRVPMNTFLSNNEIEYRLKDSNSKVLFCDSHTYDRAMNIVENVNHEILIIPVENNNNDISLKNIIINQKDENFKSNNGDSDISLLMYTGGTTGKSKGVIHTHKSIISVTYSEIVELEIEENVVMLHTAPLTHSNGFFLLPGLLKGGMQILEQRFTAQSFCEIVEKEKVSFTFLVPTMIYSLLDLPDLDSYKFDSLKTIVYGAAPMAPNRIREAINIFGPVFIQIYSQAEVANQTTVLSKTDHVEALNNNENILSSCGREIIMSKLRIVKKESNVDCSVGEIGELITKGPHMMKGYWNLPDETKKTIIDGWLYTGDIGYKDENDFIYLVDRKNDIIISGGFNVYTTSVEKVIFEHPNVKQCTVIGVPDEKWGESVKAIVVLNKNNTTKEEIINYSKDKLAKYEIPKTINFVDELPMTPYGKIDKKMLREEYWGNKNKQIN